MIKKNPVKLKTRERKSLQQQIRKGTGKARTMTRSRILLLTDEGKSDSQIMNVLGISRNTVRQVRERYVKEGVESAIHERHRTGAPMKFTGKQKAKITALACSKAPEGRSRWSLHLLADKVVELNIAEEISFMTIDRLLKKTNCGLI